MNQIAVVEEYIEECFDQGMNDKIEIFDKVEAETQIPRPSIRRIASGLKKKYAKQIDILEQARTNYEKSGRPKIPRKEVIRY